MEEEEATFVVIGGGIAGVSCVETLAFLQPDQSILLVSESSLIKTVTNLTAITRTLTEFDIVEKNFNSLSEKYQNVKVIHDLLMEIDDDEQFIFTKTRKVKYKMLCICSGAEPKLIPQADKFPQILGIRDTDSVTKFVEKLADCKKVAIVGNGGIATELVYKIENAQIDWIIKDKHISSTFIDPGAAEFFQPTLFGEKKVTDESIKKRMRFSEEEYLKSGAALGPDWYKNLIIKGSGNSAIHIHYETEIVDIKPSSGEYPLEITLSNNDIIYTELVVSATGVSPRHNFKTKNNFKLSEDGGIEVDAFMRSNLKNIYAAGDCCTAKWNLAKHWFQMKLWTQARQMGTYAAKAMSGHFNNEEVLQDFCFEMFAHSTKLFGFKVILLGLYNGQKLGRNYEVLLRMTRGQEYIKLVLENHRLQGAVLIGDTDLEEMCENLILNQLDLEPYGDDILNPDIDIEDYFD